MGSWTRARDTSIHTIQVDFGHLYRCQDAGRHEEIIDIGIVGLDSLHILLLFLLRKNHVQAPSSCCVVKVAPARVPAAGLV